MSFIRRLFGRRNPDKTKCFAAMMEMAAESERTYRGMIATYNSDVALGVLPIASGTTVLPTGRGVYKARLFGALFMVRAFVSAAQSSDEAQDLANVATGLALQPLAGETEPRIDREEATSFAMDYVISTLKAMNAAFDAGHMLPGMVCEAHLALCDHLHDALAESIGGEGYTIEIRERFAVVVQANTAMTMNAARRWVDQ